MKTLTKNLLLSTGALILVSTTQLLASTRSVLLLTAAVFATFNFSPAGFASTSPAAEFKPFTLSLKPGSSPATVRANLGVPDAILRPDIWIYWNFGPNRDNPEVDTLVVAFENDCVLAVKFTDGRVVRRLLAEVARSATNTTFAAAPGKR